MRTTILTVTLFALIGQGGVAFAQQDTQGGLVEATPIEKVLDANPEPDGKAYRIDLLLNKGTRVAYKIPLSETAKIIDGLSKSAIAGGQNQKVATILSSMSIETDSAESRDSKAAQPIRFAGVSCNSNKWCRTSRGGAKNKD